MDFNDLVLRLAAAVHKRRTLFLLVFLAVFLGAVGGAYVKPARFESTATLFVSLQSARVSTSLADQQQIRAVLQPEEIMAAQVEIMLAREVMERLVDELPDWVFEAGGTSDRWYVRLLVVPLKRAIEAVRGGLEAVRLIEPPNERFSRIQTLEDGLTVFPVRKAQIIEITFRSKDPRVPPVVIEKLIAIYRERARALMASSQGFDLYHERALQLSEDLAEAERARTAFLLEHDIVDPEGERQLLLTRLQERRLRTDEERLRELIAAEPQLNLLTRNVEILAQSYQVYRQAADDRQTFFDRDNEITAQLIDAPTVIYQKYTRSRLALVLLGLAGAILLALLVVLLVEWISGLRRVRARQPAHSARPTLVLRPDMKRAD